MFSLSMTRTFHPVGQGAFYTESFFDNDKNIFNVVFDCGSGNSELSNKNMRNLVAKAFEPKATVDLLFISHFHNDHVNLLNAIKTNYNVKNIIIPLFDIQEFDIILLLNKLFKLNINENFLKKPIDYLKAIFGETTTILPVASEKLEDTKSMPKEYNIDNIKKELHSLNSQFKQINSRDFFIKKFQNKEIWKYIPYNYDSYQRIKLLKQELYNQGLNLKNLENFDNLNKKQKKSIRKCYDEIGGINENSMVVFSVPMIQGYITNNPRKISCCYCHLSFAYKNFIGCVYMGDYDAKKNFKSELSNLFQKYSRNIATIQIPHHGSKHNFNEKLTTSFYFLYYIISYGIKNHFHHPSGETIVNIAYTGYPILVNEQKNTSFVQKIQLA